MPLNSISVTRAAISMQRSKTYAMNVQNLLSAQFQEQQFAHTGAFRRQLEIIDELAWVTTATNDALQPFFEANNFSTTDSTENTLTVKGAENIPLKFYLARPDNFFATLFSTSSSEDFSQAWQSHSRCAGNSHTDFHFRRSHLRSR